MNIEYKNQAGEYPVFQGKVKDKKVAVVYDYNTAPFAEDIKKKLEKSGSEVQSIYFDDKDLIPDENVVKTTTEGTKNADYLLAVGSGSLNDVAKKVATDLGIESGVLATAGSMDGYCSKGSALMQGGIKLTFEVNTPSDVLIDPEIIRNAPREMTASGFGDIVGKFTCLTDWDMAHIVKGEPIHEKAYKMMEEARSACMDAFEGLTKYEPSAVSKRMDALITAGLAMAECGNSRPASGSEHHISHFLEMDFVRRGERVPLHGVKVAIGTLVSIELYNYLKREKVTFPGAEEVYKLVDKLPTVESVKEMLIKVGCPTRFSEIGVRKETAEEAFEKAYTVRDRYTVLTLIHELGLTEKVKPILMEKYY